MDELAYIYYEINPETLVGKIHAVSPAPSQAIGAGYSCLEVPRSSVIAVMEGKRSPSFYVVVPKEDGSYQLALRAEFSGEPVFAVPYLVQLTAPAESAHVLMSIDMIEKAYTISLSVETRSKLFEDRERYAGKLLPEVLVFYIISKDTPSVIVDQIEVNVKEMIVEDYVRVPFYHNLPKRVSVVSPPVFPSGHLEIRS